MRQLVLLTLLLASIQTAKCEDSEHEGEDEHVFSTLAVGVTPIANSGYYSHNVEYAVPVHVHQTSFSILKLLIN